MKICRLALIVFAVTMNPVLIYSQWSKIYDDIPLSEGYFNCLEITPDSSMYYGTGKHIFKSNTLGYSWEEVFSDAGALSIDCVGNDTCYCAGFYSEIGSGGVSLRTFDGGESWQLPNSYPLYWPSNVDVFVLTDSQVYICGGDGFGYVQTTTNGFDNVTITVPSFDSESIGAISCANPDTCICVAGSQFDVVGEDYRVYKTLNGGESWNESIAANFGRDIVHIDENLVYLLERWVLIKSTNGGDAWDTIKEYTGNPGSHFVAMKFVDENFGYLAEQFDVQDSIAIYRTDDGGINWQSTVINDMPIGIFDIDCINKEHCFFIGGFGEIYSTENGGIPNSIFEPQTMHINIYPNPVHAFITIESLKTVKYTVNLFSSLGEDYVCTDFIGQVKLDVENYPSGVYLVVITDFEGNLIKSQEIILQ